MALVQVPCTGGTKDMYDYRKRGKGLLILMILKMASCYICNAIFGEYDKYRVVQDRMYLSDFDKEVKRLKGEMGIEE